MIRRYVLAAALLLPATLIVAVPDLLYHRSPTAVDLADALRPPSGAHWFGTDQLGRDVLARVLHGAAPSWSLGLGATVFALAGGILLGLLAALAGRVADHLLLRATDLLLSLPPLLLALLAVTVLGTGRTNVMLAVAIAFIPVYARMVRSEVLAVRRSGYVEAAVGLGVPRVVLALRHVVPNTLGPLSVLGTIGFGSAILYGSGLSFLGLGARPPAPEWGAMLSEGRSFLASAWWVGVFPGLAITVSVLAVTVLGRQFRVHLTGRENR
ncbi:ABC transporter permease [Amycolatopsis ultiminotia]|uniref:ABC transporter permease n=1 Tax=Amycolatopsis ultiminotia TaxID=543629 RepID=A0ABP6XIA3_9PSEU